jgi:hypothetical protein
MERATAGRNQPQLVHLLERALNALYASARKVLGEVTLAAIVDRVLFTAAERHAFLADLRFESSSISAKKLLERSPAPDESALRDAMRFVLIEMLTVLGNLTAELLTPAFYSELSSLEELVPLVPPHGARVAGEEDDQ